MLLIYFILYGWIEVTQTVQEQDIDLWYHSNSLCMEEGMRHHQVCLVKKYFALNCLIRYILRSHFQVYVQEIILSGN